ncbi:MAG: DUF4845 domain-containing protein [Pseudomonadota bacterium]
MKQLSIKPLVIQRGSFYTMAVMLLLLGGALTCALKITPLYMDNAAIRNSMEGIVAKDEFKTMSIGDIRNAMLRALTVNNIDGFDAGNIVVTREGAVEYVDINYEARVNIISNIYAVVDFKNRFDK